MQRRWSALLACCAALAVPSADAQYKVIDGTGRITYTDRPPAQGERQRVQPLGVGGATPSSIEALPYELRQPARQFPVTLYAMQDCSACDSGRVYLRRRGIPFAEKSIVSNADRDAFEKLNLGDQIPVLRIGQQVLRGFAEESWSADLTLAGYPERSRLPSGYSGWEPTPMAEAPPARAPAPPARAQPPVAAPAPAPADSNPTGIRF